MIVTLTAGAEAGPWPGAHHWSQPGGTHCWLRGGEAARSSDIEDHHDLVQNNSPKQLSKKIVQSPCLLSKIICPKLLSNVKDPRSQASWFRTGDDNKTLAINPLSPALYQSSGLTFFKLYSCQFSHSYFLFRPGKNFWARPGGATFPGRCKNVDMEIVK